MGGNNRNFGRPHERTFGFFGGEIGTSYSWRPGYPALALGDHGGSSFFSDQAEVSPASGRRRVLPRRDHLGRHPCGVDRADSRRSGVRVSCLGTNVPYYKWSEPAVAFAFPGDGRVSSSSGHALFEALGDPDFDDRLSSDAEPLRFAIQGDFRGTWDGRVDSADAVTRCPSTSPNPKLLTAKDTQRWRWVPGTPRPEGLIGEDKRNF